MVATPDIYGFAPGVETARIDSVHSNGSQSNSPSKKLLTPNSTEHAVKVADSGGIADLEVLQILTSTPKEKGAAENDVNYVD